MIKAKVWIYFYTTNHVAKEHALLDLYILTYFLIVLLCNFIFLRECLFYPEWTQSFVRVDSHIQFCLVYLSHFTFVIVLFRRFIFETNS